MKEKKSAKSSKDHAPSNAKRPKILVCNDDGIDAEGLDALVRSMKKIGDVTVVAPLTHQSGMGHAMTLGKPLRINKWHKNKKFFGYAVNGTPVDCVKAAMTQILKHQKPDLMVSGINYGTNTAINILYSGTVAAAVEASLFGVPSIAFSLTTYENADFEYAAKFARKLALETLKRGLPAETLLTVNIPNLPEKDIKGVVITAQGKSKWEEEMVERSDTYGQPYYWIRGVMKLNDSSLDADEYAVRHGYVSVTPICYDLTNYRFMETLRQWNLKK
ncbi:MAG: 5'/3'-nucleotidase SurE [Chloroherpetonaceae bacterium]|nr:5'/3'-nucleotidase SurE [Chloroherpetonaceae bacterium]MDW8438074.1 5'/3'-nucleotidase SurE [Chloroherpetonaceae bacterium]